MAASSSSTSTTTTAQSVLGSAVYLSIVDDFTSASQACVNPLFAVPPVESPQREATPISTSAIHDDTSTKSTTNDSTVTSAASVVIPKQRKRRPRAIATTSTERVGTSSIVNVRDTETTTTSSISRHGSEATTTTNTASPLTVVSAVSATIADCLACSGCVTTAETLLLSEQHSLFKLKEVLFPSHDTMTMTVAKPTVVMTLSPAAWADLARHCLSYFGEEDAGITTERTMTTMAHHRELQKRVTTLLYECLNVSAVLDGAIPLQWSLEASAKEFCAAYHGSHSSRHRPCTNASVSTAVLDETRCNDAIPVKEQHERNLVPSLALSSTRTQYWLPPKENTGGSVQRLILDDATTTTNTKQSSSSTTRVQQALPIITASCPAVTCLVEKYHHQAVPHLSTVVSPMTAAALFWSRMSEPPRHGQCHQDDIHTKDMTETVPPPATTAPPRPLVFHLAVMPCHDKKLEASRKDFLDTIPTGGGIPRVDVVVTTTELWQLLLETCRDRHLNIPRFLWHTPEHEQRRNGDATATQICEVDLSLDQMDSNGSNNDAFAVLRKHYPYSSGPILYVSAHVSNITDSIQSTQMTGTDGFISDIPPFFAAGSGGYADFVFRYAAYHLFGVNVTEASDAIWCPVSNRDHVDDRRQQDAAQQQRVIGSARMRKRRREYYEAVLCLCPTTGSYHVQTASGNGEIQATNTISTGSSTVVLRFAVVYGMQTVQSALNQHVGVSAAGGGGGVRTDHGQSYYDYVEAMACPGSCINGGGQLRLVKADRRETPKETRERIHSSQKYMLHATPLITSSRGSHNGSIGTAQPSVEPTTEEAMEPSHPWLHTRFHVVPPMQHSFGAAAGVAVEDTVW